MSTANGSQTKNSKLINGLVIYDYEETNFINLPPVYTINKIPATAEEIVKNADISRFEHLCHLNLPESSEDIGLLIGSNVPQANDPYEVNHCTSGNIPHVLKTMLG